MGRSIITAAVLIALVPSGAQASGPQDSLRVGTDSTHSQARELVFLSDDAELSTTVDQRLESEATYLWFRDLPETLEDVTGTLSPEYARNTGFPPMRGLNAKRTALTFDGVPLDHSGLREGPSAIPVASIDPAVIEGFRVVRGPVTSGSPSGGLAGSIDIRPSMGVATDPVLLVRQQFSSADRGWSGAASAAGSVAGTRFRLGGSGRLLGDLRMGSDGAGGGSLQPNSSLRESALYGLFSRDLNDAVRIRGGFVGSWRKGQATVTDLQNLRISPMPKAAAIFDPLRFTMAYVAAQMPGVGPVADFETTLWYNGQREARTFRKTKWDRTVFDDDRLDALGGRVIARFRPRSGHTLSVSADMFLEGAETRRWEVRDDGSMWGQRGRFPGGTKSRRVSVGFADSWVADDDLTVSGSMRLSSRMLHSAYGPSVFGLTGLVGIIDRTHTGVSWRADVTKGWESGWTLAASVSSGFRAPGLDEQIANAYWLYGRDVPNPDLSAERATQLELGGRYENDGLVVGMTFFRTHYSDLIARDWFERGPDRKAGTEDDLFRFMNQEPATVAGTEMDVSSVFNVPGDIQATVFGRLAAHVWSTVGEAAPQFLPPVVGRIGSRLAKGSVWLEPYVRFSSRTPAPAYSVIEAVAGDTGAWVTLNVIGGGRIGERLLVAGGLENIGNVRYLEHGSYFQSPGRNLVLSASVRF